MNPTSYWERRGWRWVEITRRRYARILFLMAKFPKFSEGWAVAAVAT